MSSNSHQWQDFPPADALREGEKADLRKLAEEIRLLEERLVTTISTKVVFDSLAQEPPRLDYPVCEGCRHYCYLDGPPEEYHFSLDSTHLCMRYRQIRYSLIFGDQSDAPTSAMDARTDESLCGLQGRGWEPKADSSEQG